MCGTCSLSDCPMTRLVLHFFFLNDTATPQIYTLSLHDALPISTSPAVTATSRSPASSLATVIARPTSSTNRQRSEEHTSELQSLRHLVCRLLLEKKKKIHISVYMTKQISNAAITPHNTPSSNQH